MNFTKSSAIKIVKDKNEIEEKKIQGIFFLMNIADDESLDAIIYCLKNDVCPIVRHEAAFALGETASNKAVLNLKIACKEDKSTIVIHESLLAIATIAKKEDINFLNSFLENKDEIIRKTAKIAIQRLNLFDEPYRGPKFFEK